MHPCFIRRDALAARNLRGAAQLDLAQSILVPAWHPGAAIRRCVFGEPHVIPTNGKRSPLRCGHVF